MVWQTNNSGSLSVGRAGPVKACPGQPILRPVDPCPGSRPAASVGHDGSNTAGAPPADGMTVPPDIPIRFGRRRRDGVSLMREKAGASVRLVMGYVQ